MRINRIICALLAVALLPMAAGALAEGTAILFPIKAGMLTEGRTVTLKPGLVGLKLSDLTWGSSNPEVLATHGNTVTAVKPGVAILGAKAGSAVAKCGVLVLPAQIRLAAGERYELPRGGVEVYRMKDEAIASVDGTGVVTGLAAGETLLGVKLVIDGVFRGINKMSYFVGTTTFELVLRLFLAFLVTAPLGLSYLWCAWPVGWFITLTVTIFLYRRSAKRGHDFSKRK